jgi:hypothetical protein
VVIRQLTERLLSGCRILPGYPTTHRTFALRLSDSSGLSDNSQNGLLSGCRILPVGYPTTHRTVALWLSDSSGLSDNSQNVCSPVVGFFRVIRQPARRLLSGCRILPGYPTTHRAFALRLSDSSGLSDNSQNVCSPVVGFFVVIRQLTKRLLSGCRILPGYPTTHKTFALRLSDSSWLSDNSQNVCSPVVGFFRVIRQLTERLLSGCRIFRVIRLSPVVGFFVVIRQITERLLSGCRILLVYPTAQRKPPVQNFFNQTKSSRITA